VNLITEMKPMSGKLKHTIIHFFPPMLCEHCARWTNLAIIDPDLLDSFCPRCALHGYVPAAANPNEEPTREEIERQHQSVKRFVIWAKGDTGEVSEVFPISDLASIPGYQPDPEAVFQEEAWHALYVSPLGEQTDCFVIWSPDDFQFFLLEEGKQVEIG
jgi:hypothetical protein